MPGPLLIFIAAVMWGLDGVLRRSLFSLPPITIVFYEHLIGAVVIAPFFFRAWKDEHLSKREWGAITLVALLSGVLGTLFFTTALQKVHFISFSVVFLIQKLQPIFTVATAWIVLGERVTRRYFLWAGLALVAGFFVTFPFGMVDWGDDSARVTAAFLALLAAIAWGCSTAFSRFTLLEHSNTYITGLRFFLTVPIAFVFVLALRSAPSLSAVAPIQLATLLLIALSTGMIALWVYYRGLRTTRANVSTIIELAFPVTAVLVDVFLYHTILSWSQYTAAVVLFFAMYMIAQLNSKIIADQT